MTACEPCRAEVVAELRAALEAESDKERRAADADRRKKQTRDHAANRDRLASGYAHASGFIRDHEKGRQR